MPRALQIVFAAIVCTTPAAALSQWNPLAPGIEIYKTAGVWRVRVDLCEPGLTIRATRPGERGVTTAQRRAQVGDDVTVNGDFYVGTNKTPVGLAVGQGQHWSGTKDPATHGGLFFGSARVEFDEGPLTRAFDASWMTDVVGGFPALVVGGGARNYTESQCAGSNKHTAVGFSADKRTMYMVVAQSITCGALANLMRDLGSDFALNLDGGGSSDMATAAGTLIGSSRLVSNHLGVKGFGNGVPHVCVDRRLPSASGRVRRHVVSPASLSAWAFTDLHYVAASDAQINQFLISVSWPETPKLVRNDSNGKLLIRDHDQTLRHVGSPRSLRYWKLDGRPTTVATGTEGARLPEMPILVRRSDGAVFVIDAKPAEEVLPTPDASVDAKVIATRDASADVMLPVSSDAALDGDTPSPDAAYSDDSAASNDAASGVAEPTNLSGGCRVGPPRSRASASVFLVLFFLQCARIVRLRWPGKP